MILLNFAHPMTEAQLARIAELTGEAVDRVVDVKTHFDNDRPFADQAVAVVDQAVEQAGLSSAELQTVPILVNPPALNFNTAALLAELHGRMGYFPPIVRTRPAPDTVPPRFDVAEIVNLQAIREAARGRR